MIQLQIICKVLQDKSMDIIKNNFLTVDYFWDYPNEFQFIEDHVREYGNVPDKETFLGQFPDIELLEVNETERYMIDTIREEYLFHRSVPIMKQASDIFQTDSNAAIEFISSHLDELQPNYGLGGTDIVKQSEERFNQFKERKENQGKFFFETGFKELDDIIHGIQRGEEFLVILARSNVGKTWLLEKICAHVWQTGFNVGFIEPEMSSISVGFRFDTLINHHSNKGLMYGNADVEEDSYIDWLNTLKSKDNRFIVATQRDFKGAITASKIEQWVKQYNLDLVAIDGLTYITDERARKGDNESTMLMHVSEDLMSLSVALKIPILTVVQANRTGVIQDEVDGAPEADSVRGSDGILFNASKLLSLRQRKDKESGDITIEIWIKKQRFGAVGGKVAYHWDINTGIFTYVQSEKKEERRKAPSEKQRKEDMF